MDATAATLDSIYEQADRLSDADKLELIARLATPVHGHAATGETDVSPDEKRRVTKAELQREYEQRQASLLEQKMNSPKRNVRGILADPGPAPTEEDIAEARREMMQNFPREDIAYSD